MLVMRPDCERCGADLLASAGGAFICSFECTFCADCANALDERCPNCGGALVDRPTRVGKVLWDTRHRRSGGSEASAIAATPPRHPGLEPGSIVVRAIRSIAVRSGSYKRGPRIKSGVTGAGAGAGIAR